MLDIKPKSNDTEYVYIGRDNCGYGQEFLPEISKTLKKNNLAIKFLDNNVRKDQHKMILKKLLKNKDDVSEEYGEIEEDLMTVLTTY